MLLNKELLKEGETLLVLGAAGGRMAVEIGKAMGAKVIAAASSEEKVKVCLEHGADETIVYSDSLSDRATQKQFSNKIKELLMGKEPMLYMILLAVIAVSRAIEQPHGKVDIWLLDFATGEIP